MSYNIISGMSQVYYHTIPDNLDLITTTPTREGIFKYISQIDFDMFPEFILDILTKVEGHQPVDVTDGQGDEKQDILTINPDGDRCLTQCKHTVEYKSHYNGDDLDLLASACLRKQCKEGIFVTNSDLTPQGKKYVNDKEYSRGFKNPADCLVIDYWNGFKIWDKIKNNQDIINKWFSGLGQAHGLRSFKFDLSIQELPFKGRSDDDGQAFDRLINALCSKAWFKEIVEGLHYRARISKKYDVNVKKWFQFTGRLDINFVLPENDYDFINKPLYALTIEVVLNTRVGKYSPKAIRDEIVAKIAAEVLSSLADGRWWHITASQIKGLIYLHDISEPREIDLFPASTFVKTNSTSVFEEYAYCSLSNAEFDVCDNDEDTTWTHKKSNVKIIQMFDQRISPADQYNALLLQKHQLDQIASYDFHAIENIDTALMTRIRRLLQPEWIAFQCDDNVLIWAENPTSDKEIIGAIHTKIAATGVEILSIKDSDIEELLHNVRKDLLPISSMIVSNRTGLCCPIMLNKRIFWLSKELVVDDLIDFDKILKLVEFKYAMEYEHGYDVTGGKGEQTIGSIEVFNILFDLFTIRGKRMLDIAINEKTLSINIRFAESRVDLSNSIALEYIQEFVKICDKIYEVVN